MRIQFRAATVLLFSIFLFSSIKSDAKNKKDRTGSIYFSWGYNTEWYTKSTVTIKQPGLGNDYEMVHVNAHDHRGWDEGLFHKAFTIPQYNYRLGYYFNKKQDLGIEINFDHTKYLIADGQQVHLKGTLANKSVDEQIFFAQSNGFYYFLNNGANFLLFNLVKRVPVYNAKTCKLKVDLTGKAGIGPVIPHVQNDLFGQINAQQFQLGGWNTGAETAVRITVMKYAYFEFSQKVDYARYSHLLVYDGRAKQNFGTYELILSLGFIIPTTKHNPSFTPAGNPTENIK